MNRAWLCRWFGHKRPLVWAHRRDRPLVITSGAMELIHASSLTDFAVWNGWCPRCNQPIEWSQDRPKGAVIQVGAA